MLNAYISHTNLQGKVNNWNNWVAEKNNKKYIKLPKLPFNQSWVWREVDTFRSLTQWIYVVVPVSIHEMILILFISMLTLFCFVVFSPLISPAYQYLVLQDFNKVVLTYFKICYCFVFQICTHTTTKKKDRIFPLEEDFFQPTTQSVSIIHKQELRIHNYSYNVLYRTTFVMLCTLWVMIYYINIWIQIQLI